ncbi:MAG: hypothetical protein M3R46_08135, partial [Actinomycetota bacterium]|nr:hypothetical protein [Actinomycetota bacterium]
MSKVLPRVATQRVSRGVDSYDASTWRERRVVAATPREVVRIVVELRQRSGERIISDGGSGDLR